MTWAFVYFAALIVGVVLASVTGLLSGLRVLRHHPPDPGVRGSEHHLVRLGWLGRRLAVALVCFGCVGLPLTARRTPSAAVALAGATISGVVGLALAAVVLSRRARGHELLPTALVVQAIPAAGYGIVRLGDEGESHTRAARSADAGAIATGTRVEITDASRSVLVVRPLPAA